MITDATEIYRHDANLLDKTAKMWDGDEMTQAAQKWLTILDENIEANPDLRDIVFHGAVALRNGKTAMDSNSALSLIHI